MRAIDLFAGAGGFTAGASMAGVDVVWAANHWRDAVDTHALNHPETAHVCQDLLQADWRRVPDCDLLLASPACQGHSQAGQPGRMAHGQRIEEKHFADRNTAWAVISAAEIKRPSAILVENVADFLRWPLLPAWRSALGILGYEVREHVFDCADFGVPQNRLRAVITAGLGRAIELRNPKRPHVGFGPSIDWGSGDWAPLHTKPEGVRRRVDAARARGLGDRFLSHYVTGHKGRELDRPIGCITTKAQWAVVDGDSIRMLSTAELRRGMAFPEDYRLPTVKKLAIKLLGNAIPPTFARDLIEQTSDTLERRVAA